MPRIAKPDIAKPDIAKLDIAKPDIAKLSTISPCFEIFQCVFNLHSMCIQYTFNVIIIPVIWLMQTYLLTHSLT